MINRIFLLLNLIFLFSFARAEEMRCTVVNPTNHSYSKEALRLKLDLPPDFDSKNYLMEADGKEVPYQIAQSKEKKEYVTLHGFEPLDKLHNDYILTWPGLEEILRRETGKKNPKLGGFKGMDLYSSWMNPTSMLRGLGKRIMRSAGGAGNLSTLTQAQVFLDKGTYGSYWNFWSPENPNFFTDFNRCGIALVSKLKEHPRFKELVQHAKRKFREDLYHSITLPGGAGQECPGYVAYAMHTWKKLAAICKEHLGFDATEWPRYRAGASFLLHLSQPVGNGRRRCHPGGDTHPLGPDVFEIAGEFGVMEDVRQFKTEELPGFGVVFRNKSGTGNETYLAFKSGPNRGHYHGDQLSFHCCAHAKPLVIDHMCSYSPRAGQEHMHNRVAFHTEKLPYANMDGYERVIAFKPSESVDIAVGQVSSQRLRITTKYPPEEWDTYLPQQRFDKKLVYRRTIVFLKGKQEDYFVIRDQHKGPEVKATWCLHVLSKSCKRIRNTFKLDGLTVFCAEPRNFEYGRHDWAFEKKRHGKVKLREATKGLRLTAAGNRSEFITVLYPSRTPPPMERIKNGVRVGDDRITFSGGITDENGRNYVVVKRKGKSPVFLTGDDIDINRSQGRIGLFVPDAGYPFGRIPAWLIKQRNVVPDWAPGWAKKLRKSRRRIASQRQ